MGMASGKTARLVSSSSHAAPSGAEPAQRFFGAQPA
eukprot:SAG11_NODE_5501_length_1543_cov_2.661357_1_plen_35_part_10